MNIKQLYGARSARTRVYPQLLVLALSLFVVASNGFAIAGLLPNIAISFDVRLADVGYSITMYAIAVAAASPVISISLASVSRTGLMTAGLLATTGGTLLAALAPNLPLFFAGRCLSALGGAAVVPAAMAAAATLSTDDRRGRAISIVAMGITAATALGAPLGTFIASLSSWRATLLAVAALSLLSAVLVTACVRNIPRGTPTPWTDRLGTFRNRKLIAALLASVCSVASFDVVYFFSTAVTARSVGDESGPYAAILLSCGLGGMLGNALAGQLIDRLGARATGAAFFAGMIGSLVLMALTEGAPLALVLVVFALWGFASNALLPVMQFRQVELAPREANITLSWNSSALYIGVGLAPPLGDLATHLGGAIALPIAGMVVGAASCALFLQTWRDKATRDSLAQKGKK